MINYWIISGVPKETRESLERRARELRRETLRATFAAIAKWVRALGAAPAKRAVPSPADWKKSAGAEVVAR